MIMDGMLSNISQRLHEVNTLLATYGQGVLSFEQLLPPSLFYQDFNDTNLLVKEAACLVKENPGQLLDFSSSLLSETNKYLSLDRTPLQVADIETLRAKKICVLIGTKKALSFAIRNMTVLKRNTKLKERLNPALVQSDKTMPSKEYTLPIQTEYGMVAEEETEYGKK